MAHQVGKCTQCASSRSHCSWTRSWRPANISWDLWVASTSGSGQNPTGGLSSLATNNVWLLGWESAWLAEKRIGMLCTGWQEVCLFTFSFCVMLCPEGWWTLRRSDHTPLTSSLQKVTKTYQNNVKVNVNYYIKGSCLCLRGSICIFHDLESRYI